MTWSDIEALPPHDGEEEQKVAEAFNSVPWTRTGDAPAQELDDEHTSHRRDVGGRGSPAGRASGRSRRKAAGARRITLTLDTRVAQFVAGPHEAFFAGGIDPVVCAALAERRTEVGAALRPP